MSSVSTKQEIVSLLDRNRETLKGFGVVRFGLFGSFVRNEATLESDIDLVVELEEGKYNLKNFAGLSDYLETLFGRKVELLTPLSLNPRFSQRILSELEYVAIAA
jgi:predicted nucleotidyltransferase